MDPKYNHFVNYYHANKNKLFTHLMYRLNFDRKLAENLMMDIFLKAYDHLDQFNPKKGSFRVWLFAIAHNHLAKHYLNRKKLKTISPAKLKRENYYAEVEENEYQMNEQIDSKQIQYIFTFLEEDDREMISLRFLQGLSLKEIAKITGNKEEAIRKNVAQALEHLSKFYKKVYLRK